MRRPAAELGRRRVRARPAAEDPPGDGWIRAEDIELKTLRGLKVVHIQGQYWESEAEVVGEISGMLMGEDGAWVTLRTHGTSTESILKFISGRTRKELQVHLCDKPCSNLTWRHELPCRAPQGGRKRQRSRRRSQGRGGRRRSPGKGGEETKPRE